MEAPRTAERDAAPWISGDDIELDPESAAWVASLTGDGGAHRIALARLHALLVRVASAELNRRSASRIAVAAEADDLVHRAADDAMVAVLSKLASFRGESRFTTWAYRFAVLELSNQIGQHFRAHTAINWDAEEWEALTDRSGTDPESEALQAERMAAVRRAVDVGLTDHQRRAFVAIVLNGVPVDAAVGRLGPNRNAIYKTVFDARRRVRRELVENGFLVDITTKETS